MQPAFPHRIRGQQLWLSPHRCLFWEEERSLILSDLHFGKTGHFRKAGIAVPQSVYREDLLRLLSLIQYFQPRQLLVVGDLFHSRENKELNLFRRWRDDFPDLGIRLILGNHDILHEDWYEAAGITVSREMLRMGEFAFIHDITDSTGTAAEPKGDGRGERRGEMWREQREGRRVRRREGRRRRLTFFPGIFIRG
jgi:DNA ligase-associated metallophosphoesterase